MTKLQPNTKHSHVADTRQSSVQTLSLRAMSFVVLKAILARALEDSVPPTSAVPRLIILVVLSAISITLSVLLPAWYAASVANCIAASLTDEPAVWLATLPAIFAISASFSFNSVFFRLIFKPFFLLAYNIYDY